MGDHRRRWQKVKAQIDAMFPEPEPTPEDDAARAEAWNRLVTPWAEKLLESMDLEKHRWVLDHWVSHLLQQCTLKPCEVVPGGLMRTIWTLWSWKRDVSKPIALPPEVVEVYLTNDRLNTQPHLNCEDCQYPIPISFFFMPEKQVNHFPRCPWCHGLTGWHAWEIKHQVPGYAGLKPYSQR